MRRNNQNSSSKSPRRQANSLKRQSNSPGKHSPQRRSENQVSDSNKVYISGMPGGFSENEVRQLCRKYGKIIDVLVVDKQTFSFAFVQFQQQSQAQEAIKQITGTQVNNKSLRCQLAKPRLPRRDFGRGDGQRRDGGSRGQCCFKCGRQGHIARFCQSAGEDDRNGYKSKRPNGRRDREDSESSPKKQRNRKRSSSSSQSEKKRHKKRERSDSKSVRKHKKRDNGDRKRKESSSSSKDKRKSRKNKRSRSAELRKGKKRQASGSSS